MENEHRDNIWYNIVPRIRYPGRYDPDRIFPQRKNYVKILEAYIQLMERERQKPVYERLLPLRPPVREPSLNLKGNIDLVSCSDENLSWNLYRSSLYELVEFLELDAFSVIPSVHADRNYKRMLTALVKRCYYHSDRPFFDTWNSQGNRDDHRDVCRKQAKSLFDKSQSDPFRRNAAIFRLMRKYHEDFWRVMIEEGVVSNEKICRLNPRNEDVLKSRREAVRSRASSLAFDVNESMSYKQIGDVLRFSIRAYVLTNGNRRQIDIADCNRIFEEIRSERSRKDENGATLNPLEKFNTLFLENFFSCQMLTTWKSLHNTVRDFLACHPHVVQQSCAHLQLMASDHRWELHQIDSDISDALDMVRLNAITKSDLAARGLD